MAWQPGAQTSLWICDGKSAGDNQNWDANYSTVFQHGHKNKWNWIDISQIKMKILMTKQDLNLLLMWQAQTTNQYCWKCALGSVMHLKVNLVFLPFVQMFWEGKDLKRVNWPKNQSNTTGEQRDQTSSSGLSHNIWQRYRLGIVTIKYPKLTVLLKRKAKKRQIPQSSLPYIRSWLNFVINLREITVFVEGFCSFNQCNHWRFKIIRYSLSQLGRVFCNIWLHTSQAIQNGFQRSRKIKGL